MVAKGGHRLLDQNAEQAIVDQLFPLATLITPNLEEAQVLLGHKIESLDEMKKSALELGKVAKSVLLKGGHLPGDVLYDVLVSDGNVEVFEGQRVQTNNTHGTGCTLSAAIAAGIARGNSLYDSVNKARRFVFEAIKSAPSLGAGHGPLNHCAGTTSSWI
jgi:hydroxymethylpyrimidine/phosphomethylpyrimidine kinase